MWQAEADTALTLSALPATAVGQILLEYGTCLVRHLPWSIKSESDFAEHVVRYDPPTVGGTFKAFSTIMFAFAGASTFPTIQADMKERDKFSYSAVIACTSKWTKN